MYNEEDGWLLYAADGERLEIIKTETDKTFRLRIRKGKIYPRDMDFLLKSGPPPESVMEGYRTFGVKKKTKEAE